jgi:protein SCO1/2
MISSQKESHPPTQSEAPSLVPWHKNPFLYAALLGVLGIPLLYAVLPRRIPKPPPIVGQLSAFTLQDQDGKAFGLEQMKGSVSIVSFFFTRCPDICPRLVGQVAKLHQRIKQADAPFKLVSITVDPKYDQPARLRAYGERFGADFARWHFLTGSRKAIYKLAEEGFRTAVNTAKEQPSIMELTHTEKLILIDPKGRLRGYYDATALGLDEVFHRAAHVLRESRMEKR